MSGHNSQLITDLHDTYPITDTYLSPSGQELLETDPDAIEAFIHAGYRLTQTTVTYGDFEWIDRGRFSHIYGLPGHDDKCVKVVSSRTMHDSWMTERCPRLPNLVNEARFMHAVGRRLGHNVPVEVLAPKQYAVVRFAGGAALLQERIPEEFAVMDKLLKKAERNEEETEAELVKRSGLLAVKKLTRALGHSMLRFGAGDIIGELNEVNLGNFFIEREKPAEQSRFYVIDLVGRQISRRLLAFAASAFSS